MVLVGGEDLRGGVGQGVAGSGEGLALLRKNTSKTKVNHLHSGIVRATSEEEILHGEREGRGREEEGGVRRGEGERGGERKTEREEVGGKRREKEGEVRGTEGERGEEGERVRVRKR